MGDLLSAIRRASVISLEKRECRVIVKLLDGPLAGGEFSGVYYPELGGAPELGAHALVNALAVEMGLGTGDLVFVLPGSGGESPVNQDHFVKLPYTPLQFPARLPAREDLSGEDLSGGNLAGVPVVVLPLHSHLAVACAAVNRLRPGAKVAFLWREGGALPVALSRSVAELKEKGLLDLVVSSGSCFGGDIESPNEYSGLILATQNADFVLVGIGPGVVGTSSAYAHGGMSAASSLNAAAALGAEPVLAPRISFADKRARHLGLSHHTKSVLEATLTGCRVALPEKYVPNLDPGSLPGRHEYVSVGFGAAGLPERFGLAFESMGRSYTDDEAFFDAAAAAVYLALGELGDNV